MSITARRMEEKQQRIESITQAALELFAEKGYSDCNMNDIAARARLGKATLYYYFPNKETLFKFLLKRETEKFYRKAIETIRGETQPLSAIHKLLFFYLDYFANNPKLLNLFFPMGKSSPVVLRRDPKWEKEAENLRAPIDRYFKQVFARSELNVPADRLLKIVWTFLIGASVKLAQGHSVKNIRAEMNFVIQILEKYISGEK